MFPPGLPPGPPPGPPLNPSPGPLYHVSSREPTAGPLRQVSRKASSRTSSRAPPFWAETAPLLISRPASGPRCLGPRLPRGQRSHYPLHISLLFPRYFPSPPLSSGLPHRAASGYAPRPTATQTALINFGCFFSLFHLTPRWCGLSVIPPRCQRRASLPPCSQKRRFVSTAHLKFPPSPPVHTPSRMTGKQTDILGVLMGLLAVVWHRKFTGTRLKGARFPARPLQKPASLRGLLLWCFFQTRCGRGAGPRKRDNSARGEGRSAGGRRGSGGGHARDGPDDAMAAG